MKIKFFLFTLIFVFSVQLTTVRSETTISTSCQGCILYEPSSGRVLYEKNSHKQMYIASITKIMTAIIAIEEGYLDEYVTISDEASRQVGSSLYLKPGEKMKLIDLIYGLMLRSGNDAAYAIAEEISGDVGAFAYLMNEKAKELGMYNSFFENPSGLDETTKNMSTAYDMAILMGYAINNPIYMKVNGAAVHKAQTEEGRTLVFYNKHRLITDYDYVTGGKTGYTKLARRTLVTSAHKNGMDLIVVTLNDGNDWDDHLRLFDYGFSRYKKRLLFDHGLFYVKELDQLFTINDDIRYPLEEKEIAEYEFVIDRFLDHYYIHLIKDDEVVLTRPIYEYNYLNNEVDVNSRSFKDEFKKIVSEFLW